MNTIKVDATLYGVSCQLTDKARYQIEDFLTERWGCRVELNNQKIEKVDLLATTDSSHDYSVNKQSFIRILKDTNVLIIGMNSLPLYALKSLVDALQEVDKSVLPIEVFATVEDHVSLHTIDDKDHLFVRFSHLNLYKREKPVYIHER